MEYKLTEKDKDDLHFFISALRNLTDDQIELISERLTEGMIREKEIFSKIVPLFGYVHL